MYLSYEPIQKVSLIILAYKNYYNLSACIKSVINQTYSNIELIFADDCTPGLDKENVENTILSLNSNKYPICFLFNSENKGTVKNFNNAIEHSTGELIVPVSIDDQLSDRYAIGKIVEHFNKEHLLLGTSYSCCVKEKQYCICPSSKELKTLNNDKTANELLTMGLFFKGANTYYHRRVFELYGMFNEEYKLYEDVPFMLKYLENGGSVGVVPYVCILYSMNGQGVSSKKNVNKLLVEDRKRMYDEVLHNSKYRRVHRWVRYNLYRNVYPNNDIEAVLKFADIIMLKTIKIMILHKRWMNYSNMDELINNIKKVNQIIEQRVD